MSNKYSTVPSNNSLIHHENNNLNLHQYNFQKRAGPESERFIQEHKPLVDAPKTPPIFFKEKNQVFHSHIPMNPMNIKKTLTNNASETDLNKVQQIERSSNVTNPFFKNHN